MFVIKEETAHYDFNFYVIEDHTRLNIEPCTVFFRQISERGLLNIGGDQGETREQGEDGACLFVLGLSGVSAACFRTLP